MFYDLNKNELSEIAKLSNIDINTLDERLNCDDKIIAVILSGDKIKVRTAKGCQFFLDLRQ